VAGRLTPDPVGRPSVASAPQSPSGLSSPVLTVLALACGAAVANNYFPQAITPLLAVGFHVSRAAAALAATTTQLGYAVGIFFLVPLGDRYSRRPLISMLFAVVAASLFLSGTTSSLTALYVLGALTGAATVVAQVLIPMSVDLVPAQRAGHVVGVLSAGLLGGVLLGRAFGGVLGQWLGWRAPYLIAGGLAALLAVLLTAVVPVTSSSVRHPYPALLATSVRLFRTQPALRRSCQYQFAMFGAFTAAWTAIALYLTGPHFGYGTGVVGLVALVGAASVFAVPVAGRWIDRRGTDAVNLACSLGALLAAPALLTGLADGLAGLLGLTAGMLLLDVSVQSSQVANQSRIFALVPGARSRLNSVYMTGVFLGGSAGSWLGARIYLRFGWAAVCGLVAVAALLALGRHILYRPARCGQLKIF
jgi:predicted MFS family arabinose efflux permease